MINVSNISKFLKKNYYGKNFIIKKVSSIDNLKNYSITFFTKKKISKNELKFKGKLLLLCHKEISNNLSRNISYIETDNPKLDYAKVLDFFFNAKKYLIHKTAIINKTAKISKNVSIGCYSVIGKNVEIKENTIIGHHVIISDHVVIGKNCHIKSGAILGEMGFGLAFDDNKIAKDILHLGSLEIQDNVLIGSNTIVNKELKNVFDDLERPSVSFHVARHTFANLARLSADKVGDKSVKWDIYRISRALGHSSVKVTELYLRGFENVEITNAMDSFIDVMNEFYDV
jgi:UDP-3-O-[3-hydroxymyristoyl] glucosamine N-acyltransferase